MANDLHLNLLKQGMAAWNRWRKENLRILPDLREAHLWDADLRGADLRGADLRGADLRGANLSGAKLTEVSLFRVNLTRVNLRGANLSGADLRQANFREADLNWADLSGADLSEANFREADLNWADLTNACLVETNFEKATLRYCRVYGISAWGLKLEQADQSNLIITDYEEPTITVDNLEVAQFIYLLLHSDKIRHVIDTITSKVVLILGRFMLERKAVLDAIREELRKRDYLPVLFDFEKPASRDITETVSTLAHMARFVIADITDARSIPQELERIVPDLPSVPVQPLLQASADEYGMFEHFKRYPWVLEIHHYRGCPETRI
ncbi:hypothetical protein HKBW3S03_01221 [Candidatus Hakubella thermalkaliphila]|uniref:Pentapeptide repeat-containing protein n=1 Tax=Candidatus Hakubella thermalkaliphila TaxID=2754717 RepID=A0A6V8PEC1_9ACTN|nr:pentapeptide repeat-containing protein [Candidatus Hakubella thermalkaliphila]MBT9169057.1 Secreted effector protein PipB2 [Bacillota bacterium]GFP19716.1 hypothetical protein HKBW3S03_01221 [Candidatus Hakubella thermalkaliphila]GFP23698.1 hypothetical protein HKBW3S09_01163 [Candidatus Hakubella thermalkaliphila]GFP31079.1 hypothetical protein HKBW3S34_01998 [Candidatus Hakubella thermalkaliphila]GFP37653.1 hypothetical protein HKBW3S44_01330 [Candidatus Hakubella thermalkaliphila]